MKTVFISLEAPVEVRWSWAAVAERIGATVTNLPAAATHGMPWNGVSARTLASLPGLAFMPAETLAIVTDRVRIGDHLPALPAVCASSVEELRDHLGTSGVYLKPKDNFAKSRWGGSLEHTGWATVDDVPAQAYAEMVEGWLVACPLLPAPVHNLEIDFAVNGQGEVLVMHCFNHGFDAADRPLRMTLDGVVPVELMGAVSTFCAANGVVGGIHNIQAVFYGGQWVVMDWNPRPTGMYPGFAHLHPGVADRGLAHMLGLPLPAPAPVYIELRPYWDREIPNTRAADVREAGLHPRWVYDRRRIARIAGVANTRAEVESRFTTLEETL